jgi:DNA-binding transcriptional regulator YiaG
LFNLSSGPEPVQSADPQPETLADPEAWVRDFLSDLESPEIDIINPTTGRPLNGVQRKMAVAEKQRLKLAGALPAAIRALRKKRGESQWAMSHELGFGHGCIVRWENGHGVPSAVAMLMLLRMCPDAETLANFGLAFPSIK